MSKTLLLFYVDSLSAEQLNDIRRVLSACYIVEPICISAQGGAFGSMVRSVCTQIDCRLTAGFTTTEPPHLCAIGEAALVFSRLLDRSEFQPETHRAVLSGPLLSCRFPWGRMWPAKSPKLQRRVWNEIVPASKFREMPFLWRVWYFRSRTGPGLAGVKGFRAGPFGHDLSSPDRVCEQCDGMQPADLHNVPLLDCAEESHYLRFGHIRDLWLPFLLGFEPADYAAFWTLCQKAQMDWRKWKGAPAGDEKDRLRNAWLKTVEALGETPFRWTQQYFNTAPNLRAIVENALAPAAGHVLSHRTGLSIWYTAQGVADALESLEDREPGVAAGLLRELFLPEALTIAVSVASNAHP
jgi:hypothetical protein